MERNRLKEERGSFDPMDYAWAAILFTIIAVPTIASAVVEIRNNGKDPNRAEPTPVPTRESIISQNQMPSSELRTISKEELQPFL